MTPAATPEPSPTFGPGADPSPVPIAEYAVLGDGRTAALVSRRGSVDWLCLPGFDSAACFAALLGDADHGRWVLTVPAAHTVQRRYLDDSFVLETTCIAPTGTAVVTEAMPLGDGRADLIRRLTCTDGTVEVWHEWIVRFGYGAIEPWVMRIDDPSGGQAVRAIAGPDSLVLRGDRLPRAHDHRHTDRFTLRAGETVELALTWVPSWAEVPALLTIADRLDQTRIRWRRWAAACAYEGPYRDAVIRSLLVLRLLTDEETGGIVAAPTTSLPEDFGGGRNWDYRFCWLRDAAMTLEALVEHGYHHEATRWRDWLLRAVAGDPADLQIMYRVDGGRDLPERELTHLPGYGGARPVRIGNAAVGQVQNDVLGEVMCALDQARRAGIPDTPAAWSMQRHLVDHLLRSWQSPDRGIWEVRGEPRHFVHSKVMAWAAVDRAVRAVEEHGLPGPVERWRAARDAIHADVLRHGWNHERGTFVQSYGAQHTDAALLQLVQVGFLPADDERVLATVAAVRQELEVAPGLLWRYHVEHTDDGVPGDEQAFMACSFWLADALARTDQLDEATAVLDRLVAARNDVGLLAEQLDPVSGRMAGNFPQALSHLALARAVHSHAEACARAAARPGSV
ncbi:glycoside hydrolase family 15 protein [Cellulomonas composti]|nr:glycoside hydrolase family 15 protein [Cellulomonas composti]